MLLWAIKFLLRGMSKAYFWQDGDPESTAFAPPPNPDCYERIFPQHALVEKGSAHCTRQWQIVPALEPGQGSAD